MTLTPEAKKILEGKWVKPKKNDWGFELKKGAPPEVKKEFEEIMRVIDEYQQSLRDYQKSHKNAR